MIKVAVLWLCNLVITEKFVNTSTPPAIERDGSVHAFHLSNPAFGQISSSVVLRRELCIHIRGAIHHSDMAVPPRADVLHIAQFLSHDEEGV